MCPCSTTQVTVEHLQTVLHTEKQRGDLAYRHTSAEKIFSPLESLQCTAAFIQKTGVPLTSLSAFDEEG